MPQLPLEQLFRTYLDLGDERALEQLMRRSRPTLRRLARRLGASADDAEDLVQETFVAAIQGADRYDAARPMLPWLKGILTFRAARLARDEMRRRRHYEARRELDESQTTAPTDATRLEAEELDRDVRDAIDDLPERYREPLLQYLLAQRSPREIAATLGVERATVRVRLHRGVQRLREALRRWATALLALLVGREALAGRRARGVAVATGALVVVAIAVGALARGRAPSSPAPDADASTRAAVDASSRDVDAGPGSTPPADANERAPTGTAGATAALEVTIRDREGAALPDVGVFVEPEVGHDPVLHGRRAVTGADGVARFDGLLPGPTRISLDRLAGAAVVDLARGANRHVAELPTGRALRGRVLDANDRPVAHARVWIGPPADGPWRGVDAVSCDADGRFVVRACARGCWLAARHAALARGAAVACDDLDGDVVLRLGARGRPVRVVARSGDGAPLRDAVVHVGDAADAAPLTLTQGAAPLDAPPFAGRTDEGGAFVTAALAPGTHLVSVRAADHAPYRAVVHVPAGGRGAFVHEATLAAGARLAGTVRDAAGAPIPFALVAYRHARRDASVDAYTDGRGAFALACVPAGDGELFAHAEGYEGVTTAVTTTARTRTALTVTLRATARRAGRLELGGAAPPAGTQVRATWPPSALWPQHEVVVVDPDGTFALIGGPSDDDAPPRLHVRLPGEPLWRDAPAAWRGHDALVRLPRDFGARAAVRGVVRRHDGAPVPGARLFVERPGGAFTEVGETDARGAFSIGPLPAGDYRVLCESTTRDAPTVVSARFALGERDDRRLDLTSAPTGTVAVRLRRDDGRPVGDVVATIQRRDLHRRFAIATAAAWRQRLEAGDYVLSVMGRRVAWIDAVPFRVEAGAETAVDVLLRAATECTLVPRGLPPLHGGGLRLTLVDVSGREEDKTIDVPPGAPLRLGAVLPPGEYRLVHRDDGGARYVGAFVAPAGDEEPPPIDVLMLREAR